MFADFRRALCAAILVALPSVGWAEPVALIIGNNDYRPLPDVPRASRLATVKDAAREAGFAQRVEVNAGMQRLRAALEALETSGRGADGVVVYLAGRFAHTSNDTYFLAVGAGARSLEAMRREALPLSMVLELLSGHQGKAVLALADGGSFAVSSPTLSAGIGGVNAPQGVTVLAGTVQSLPRVVAAVMEGEAVLDASALAGADIALSGFVPASRSIQFNDTEIPAALSDPRDIEVGYWDAVRAINSVEAYEAYINQYPGGIYATEARERIADLRDAPLRAAEAAERALNLTRDQRRNIQRALTLLEYNPRGIDGIFGRGTRAAVAAFQSDEGFESTGYLNREQIRVLDRLARAKSRELEEEARREAERKAAEDRRYWRQTGESGQEEELRRYLDRYPSGIYAEQAKAELRAIEEIRRPRVSAVEQLTWQQVEAVGSVEAYQEYLRRYPNGAYAGSARDEIERLQAASRQGRDRQAAEQGEQRMNLSQSTRRTIEQRLATLDYNPGPVDGQFDRQTRNALLRYQQDRRLPATGYMNDATMVRVLADTVISIFD